jgi:hypothetical protein
MIMPQRSYNVKQWVKGLTLDCPLKDPDPGCPVVELRKLPVEERLALVEKMDREELKSIINHHHTCLNSRG